MSDRKEYIKKWKEENKERVRQHDKKYAELHKEKILEKNKLWREANKVYNFIWNNKNKERSRVIKENRRSKENGKISSKDWTALLKKYGNKCLACGSVKRITMDHVVPLSKGGKHHIDNIQPLCKTCNQKKFTKIIDYR